MIKYKLILIALVFNLNCYTIFSKTSCNTRNKQSNKNSQAVKRKENTNIQDNIDNNFDTDDMFEEIENIEGILNITDTDIKPEIQEDSQNIVDDLFASDENCENMPELVYHKPSALTVWFRSNGLKLLDKYFELKAWITYKCRKVFSNNSVDILP